MAAISYKGHSITLTVAKVPTGYQATISVSGPTINIANQKLSVFKTQAEATTSATTIIQGIKNKLDGSSTTTTTPTTTTTTTTPTITPPTVTTGTAKYPAGMTATTYKAYYNSQTAAGKAKLDSLGYTRPTTTTTTPTVTPTPTVTTTPTATTTTTHAAAGDGFVQSQTAKNGYVYDIYLTNGKYWFNSQVSGNKTQFNTLAGALASIASVPAGQKKGTDKNPAKSTVGGGSTTTTTPEAGWTTTDVDGGHVISVKKTKGTDNTRTTTIKIKGPKVNSTFTTTSYPTSTAAAMLAEVEAKRKEMIAQVAVAMEGGLNAPGSEIPAPYSEDTPVKTYTAANKKLYVVYKNNISGQYRFQSVNGEKKSFDTLEEAKAAISKGNGGISSEVTGGGTSDPRPKIVFGTGVGDNAPTTTEGYKTRRNGQVAANIASAMKGNIYKTETEVSTAFANLFRSQIGAPGQKYDFSNDGNNVLQDANGKAWKSTYDKIKALTLANLGIGSRSEAVGDKGIGVEGNDLITPSDEIIAQEAELEKKSDDLNTIVDATETENLDSWTARLAKVPNFAAQITTRVSELATGISAAQQALTAGGELAKKAQAIYSNENIRNMREQLVAKGFDVSKAGPAVFYQAMKDRASLSAEVMKIQADQEKTIAGLLLTKTQMQDAIRASGMEADKRIFDEVNNITAKIQAIKETADLQRATNEQNYVMKPLLDVFSGTLQIDLANMAQKYEAKLLNANPSQKIVAAAKIFGSDFAFVDNTVVGKANLPRGEFLAYVAERIRINKQSFSINVAKAA